MTQEKQGAIEPCHQALEIYNHVPSDLQSEKNWHLLLRLVEVHGMQYAMSKMNEAIERYHAERAGIESASLDVSMRRWQAFMEQQQNITLMEVKRAHQEIDAVREAEIEYLQGSLRRAVDTLGEVARIQADALGRQQQPINIDVQSSLNSSTHSKAEYDYRPQADSQPVSHNLVIDAPRAMVVASLCLAILLILTSQDTNHRRQMPPYHYQWEQPVGSLLRG